MALKRKLADADPEAVASPVPSGYLGEDSGGSPALDERQNLEQDDDQEQGQQQTQPQASSPQDRQQSNDRGSGSDPIPLASVEHYPRKRISIACNLCRFRKTKCDAARPTCGFCAGLGVQCQYRETVTAASSYNDGRRRLSTTTKSTQLDAPRQGSPKDVASLERRLFELESKWAELERQKQDAATTPGASVTMSPTAGLVVRPVSSPDTRPPPPGSGNSGMMALPAMLGGPSPPGSEVKGVDGGPPTDGLTQHRRQGSVASSTTTTTAGQSTIGSTSIAHSMYQHKRRTTRGQYTARPSLVTFECPSYVPSESYDDSGDLYDSEMAAGEDFKHQMASCLSSFPDVSKRTVRLILQKFVENFLGWIPLFEPTAVYTVVNAACASGFAPADPNSCLAMFILATGNLLQNHADIRSNPLPGLDYFSHGSRLLDRFNFMSSSLTTLHCRILQSAYFKLTLHPLLAWNVIMQSTRDSMNILSTRWFKGLDQSAREPWHRAFWACSIMADEFEASLRLHTIGHRLLRKLVCATLDVVGYHDGKVIYAPVVTHELRNQAREWHSHLPVAIRFPVDNTPLFDARKSFLRLQFFSLCTVLEWASVLKVMEAYGTERENTDDIALARVEAAECFRCCALYLEVAAEQLLGWQLGTNISLWTTFAFVAMMIVTHKAPALAFIPTTHETSHVRNALELLRPWGHLPYVAGALARMTGMMERSGITL